MGIDNINKISDAYGEEALGAEASVYVALKEDAPEITAEQAGAEAPVHPILKADENDEQVLGI